MYPAVVSFVRSLFFNDTAPTEIYTLSLHDALPISDREASPVPPALETLCRTLELSAGDRWLLLLCAGVEQQRSEEHTSELQSLRHLVCRLLLEKKKKINNTVLFDKRYKYMSR